MKIALAQIKPNPGIIAENIIIHQKWIKRAAAEAVDLIAFPELSLTGYEPTLARSLAMDNDDARLEVFQRLSDDHKMAIGLGAPTRSAAGIHISMFIFQANQSLKVYSKQKLHEDEQPFFMEGDHPLVFTVREQKIAPAICYESLQPQSAATARALGAELYLTSVAKAQRGLDRALEHYPRMASQFSMPVFMVNCIGLFDNMRCVGQSAVWNVRGELQGILGAEEEGMLIFDTETEVTINC